MSSIHQMRCFVATSQHGSFTGAAEAMGYAQPSIAEQVRRLEQAFGVELFQRHGRGVVPTEAGVAVRPHAERAVLAFEEARRAARAVRDVVAGTVRFGVFGSARIQLGGELVAALLERHPGVRVELVGQNSTEVVEAVRQGRTEAGIVVLPVPDDGLDVTPVVHDELLYVSSDPRRTDEPVDATRLAAAQLVLWDATWGDDDATRRQLARMVQAAGGTLRARVEVEDVETALDVVARGLADAVVSRTMLHRLADRSPVALSWAPLAPPLHDTFAIVHRRGATLSRATRVVVELVVDRLRTLDGEARRAMLPARPGTG